MVDKELNVICLKPKDIIKRCFFNISVERLMFEKKPALDYYQIIKDVEDEPRKFLGIRRRKDQIRNIEVFNDAIDACKSLIEKDVELFYAGVNEEENEFHAVLIGSPIANVLNYQLDQLRRQNSRSSRLIDLLSKSTLKQYNIEDDERFMEFFREKLHSYFFLVRARNGYDRGYGCGLNLSIGKYVDAHQMNIVTLNSTEKLSSPFGSGFKFHLLDFIAFYYKMYTISIDGPEMLKAIFFELYDIQLPTDIKGKEDSFYERVYRLHHNLDLLLQKHTDYNYALIVDFFIDDVDVLRSYGSKEDWTVIKASFVGHPRMQKFKGKASTIIDDAKRADFEERVMERYKEIESFFKPIQSKFTSV